MVLSTSVTDQVTIAEVAATTIKATTSNPRRLLVATFATLGPSTVVHLMRSLSIVRELCVEA